jgi:phosphomannomutase
MKFVGKRANAISCNTLQKLKQLAEAKNFAATQALGAYSKLSVKKEYIDHLLSYIKMNFIKPLKIVVNAGNGVAGNIVDHLEANFRKQQIPIEFVKIHHEPDGTFPNGVPNPLLPYNREDTRQAIITYGADLGVAWDSDFDRCFLFDEQGKYIEGNYLVGLLARAFLKKNKNGKIVHDSRVMWNTIETIRKLGGIPIRSKAGHSFFKNSMKASDAVYGGETSAHHYFRDFAYCDSGMIPWLLVIELICVEGKVLSKLIDERKLLFPCSEEINFVLCGDYDEIKRKVCNYFNGRYLKIDELDGLSMEFINWRFNLRLSNTEPLVRLNVETKSNNGKVNQYVNQVELAIGLARA